MLNTIRQNTPIHTLEFAASIRCAPFSERSIPIVAMDAYRVTEVTDLVLKKTFGKYSHRFILIEIATKPSLFARVEFQGYIPLDGQPIAHSIKLSRDLASLIPGSTSFARLANHCAGGLRLGAFATLLEVMHRRTYCYDLLSTNCFWLTEPLCTGDPVGRFFVDASLQVLKGCQWLFSLPAGDKRIRYPDEEIWEIIGEWRSLGAL
ncbi:hypothetical protein B0H10DRAFT_2006241 [Mycena sp. CBHHK59/15]|nr:hypothetical protein B0H10DRAFT_2006241 [Mycena sp. CBHHK59/15]